MIAQASKSLTALTVVARYLVESRGMTRRAALERISAKREIDLSEDIDGVLGP